MIANNATGKGSAAAIGSRFTADEARLLPGPFCAVVVAAASLHVSYSGKLGALQLLRRPHEPRHGALHLDQRRLSMVPSAEVCCDPEAGSAPKAAIRAVATRDKAGHRSPQRQLELSLRTGTVQRPRACPSAILMRSIRQIAWWPPGAGAPLETMHCTRLCSRIEAEIAATVAASLPPLGERERRQRCGSARISKLAWSHPAATAATRKRVLRTALNEVVVRKEDQVINMVLHWKRRRPHCITGQAGD